MINTCPDCGEQMFEEVGVEGYSCPDCGYTDEARSPWDPTNDDDVECFY